MGGVWSNVADGLGITSAKNQKTIASMFYCWSNDGGATWQLGVLTQVSGKNLQSLSELSDVTSGNIPLDTTILSSDDQTQGMYDAERKVLLAVLDRTNPTTIGVAYLVHSGPKPTCLQCSAAISTFKILRSGVALNQTKSDWWTRFPDVHRGQV